MDTTVKRNKIMTYQTLGQVLQTNTIGSSAPAFILSAYLILIVGQLLGVVDMEAHSILKFLAFIIPTLIMTVAFMTFVAQPLWGMYYHKRLTNDYGPKTAAEAYGICNLVGSTGICIEDIARKHGELDLS